MIDSVFPYRNGASGNTADKLFDLGLAQLMAVTLPRNQHGQGGVLFGSHDSS